MLAVLTTISCGWSLPTRPATSGITIPQRVPYRPRACGAALPAPEDLSDETLLSIVTSEMSDEDTNDLVWKYLGYKRDGDGSWQNDDVFPNWRKKYPDPPDLLGVTRTYSKQVDEPVLRAVQSLQQSVPKDHKNKLKPALRPLGWTGFKLEGLTPNMTRRAQVATWLLYYRTELHGVPVEELRRRKEARRAMEQAQAAASPETFGSDATGTVKQSVI